MMFLIPVKVGDIRGGTYTNTTSNPPSSLSESYKWSIAIWPLWLIFCLAITTTYGVILVLRATEYAAEERALSLSRASTTLTGASNTAMMGVSLGSSRAGIAIRYAGDGREAIWTPFKAVPPRSSSPHPHSRTTTVTNRTKLKWFLQRKINAFTRQIHIGLRLLRVGVIFLLPPLPSSEPMLPMRSGNDNAQHGGLTASRRTSNHPRDYRVLP